MHMDEVSNHLEKILISRFFTIPNQNSHWHPIKQSVKERALWIIHH